MSSGIKFIIDGLSDIDDPGDAKPYIRITDGSGENHETGIGERFNKRSVGKFKFHSENEITFESCVPPFTFHVYFDEGGVSSCYDGIGSISNVADETFLCELMMDGDDGMPIGEVMGRYELIDTSVSQTEPAVDETDDDELMMQAHPESTVGDNGDEDEDDVMMLALPDDSVQASVSVVEEAPSVAAAENTKIVDPAPVPVANPAVRASAPVASKPSKSIPKKPAKAVQNMDTPAPAPAPAPQSPFPTWANEVSIDQIRGSIIEQVRRDLLTVGDLKAQLSVNNVTVYDRHGGAGQLSQTDKIAVGLQSFPKHESVTAKTVTLKSGEKFHSSSSDSGDLSVFNFAGVGKPYSVMLPTGFVRGKLFVQGNFPWIQLSVGDANATSSPVDALYGGLYLPSLRFLHANSVSSDCWSSTVDVLVASRQYESSETVCGISYAVISLVIKIPLSCNLYSNKIPVIPKSIAMCCGTDAKSVMVLTVRLKGVFSSASNLAEFMSAGVNDNSTKIDIHTRLLASGSFSPNSTNSAICESFACGVSFLAQAHDSSSSEEYCVCKLVVPVNFSLVVNDIVEILLVPAGSKSPSFVAYLSLLTLLASSQSATASTGAIAGLKKPKTESKSGFAPTAPKKFACPLVARTAWSKEDIAFPSTVTAPVSCITDSLTGFTLVGDSSLEEAPVGSSAAEGGGVSMIDEIHHLRGDIAAQREQALNRALAPTATNPVVVKSGAPTPRDTQDTAKPAPLSLSLPAATLAGTRGTIKHISTSAPSKTASVSGLLHCFVKGFICNKAGCSLDEVIAMPSSSAAQHEQIPASGIVDASGSLTALNHMCKAKTISWSLAESTPGCMSFDCAVSGGDDVPVQICSGMLDMTPLIIGHSTHWKTADNTQPYCVYVPLLATAKSHATSTKIDLGSGGEVVAHLLVGVMFQKMSVSELIQYSKKSAKAGDVEEVCVKNVRSKLDESWNSLIQQYSTAVRGTETTSSYAPLSISLDTTTSCGKDLCSGGLVGTRDYETLFGIAVGGIGGTVTGGAGSCDHFVLRFRSYALDGRTHALVTTKDIIGKFNESDCLVWNTESTCLDLYQSQSSALTTTIHVQLLVANSSVDSLQCLAQAHVALSLQDLEMGLPITMTIPLRSAGKGSGGSKFVTLSLCFHSPSLGRSADAGAENTGKSVGQTSQTSIPSTLRLDVVDGYIAGMDTVQKAPFFEFAFIERGYFRSLGGVKTASGEIDESGSASNSLSEIIDAALKTENVLTYRTPILVSQSGTHGNSHQNEKHGSSMEKHAAMGLEDFDTVLASVDRKERQWGGVYAIINDVEAKIYQQFGGAPGGDVGTAQVDLLILCRDASTSKCPIIGYNVLPLDEIQFVKHRTTVWRHLNNIEDSGGDGDGNGNGAVSRPNLLDQLDDFDRTDDGTGFVSDGLAGGDELGSIKLAICMFDDGLPLPIPDPAVSRIDTQVAETPKPEPWTNSGVGCVKLSFHSVIERLIATNKGSSFESKMKSLNSHPTASPIHHIANSLNSEVRRKMESELDDADALALELDSVEVALLTAGDQSESKTVGVFKFKNDPFGLSGENSIIFPVPTSNVILALTVQTDRYKTFYTTEIDLKLDLLVGSCAASKDDADGVGSGVVFMERTLVENIFGANGAKRKRPLRVSKVQKMFLEASFIPFVKCITKVQMHTLTISSKTAKKSLTKGKGEGTGHMNTRFAVQHSNSFSFSAGESGAGDETALPELDTYATYCGFEPFNRSNDVKLKNNYDNYLNLDIAISSLAGVPYLVGEVKLCHMFWSALRKAMSNDADNGTGDGAGGKSIVAYRVCVDLFAVDKGGSAAGAAGSSRAGRIDLTIRLEVSQVPKPVVAALRQRNGDGHGESAEKAGLLLKQAFVAADTDKSGTISIEELSAAFEKYQTGTGDEGGLILQALSTLIPVGAGEPMSTKDIVSQIFAKIDVDGDGAVTWWEWMQILTQCLQRLGAVKTDDAPSAANDAVILYLLAAAEKCKHGSKWKQGSGAGIVSTVLALPSYPANASAGTHPRRNLIVPSDPSPFKPEKTGSVSWIDSSSALSKEDGPAGGVAKLHALITEMRGVNSTLAKKLEGAILDGQKMQTWHSRPNSPGSTGILSTAGLGRTGTGTFGPGFGFGGTLEGPDVGGADPLDVTSAALRKMREAEQKASVVEIALINERNRVLDLRYELETLRASEEMNRESRTTKDNQYKSINSLKEREIAETKKRLEAIEAARQRKNTAAFMIVTFLKTKAIPKLRRKLFAKKYGYLSWWLTGRAIRWKYLRYLKLRQASATKLSKLVRGGLTRKELKKQREVVALLQRIARGHKQRGLFKQMKADAKHNFELNAFNKKFDAACAIQRCIRIFLDKCRGISAAERKRLEEEEEARRRAIAAELEEAMRKSALALQRATRTHLSKLKGKKDEEAKSKFALHTKCAIILQSICRGRRDRIEIRRTRLRRWYMSHSKAENLVAQTKPTVRQLAKWTRASQDSYKEEKKAARAVNPAHRSDNACNGWWIRAEFNASAMELIVDEGDDGSPRPESPRSDVVVVFCNAYQYMAKSRLMRVFYYDFARDTEVETHLPYDHEDNAWFLDKALAPEAPVQVPLVEREPVTLYPSRRPDVTDISGGGVDGSYYIYLSDTDQFEEPSTDRPGSLSHALFKLHQEPVCVNAGNFAELEEKDIVVLKILTADVRTKNITVIDLGAEGPDTQDIIPFKSAELVWFTDSEAKIVHPPVHAKRGMSASASLGMLSAAPSGQASEAKFSPIKPRGPPKPEFDSCIGWKIKFHPDDDDDDDDDDEEEEEEVVGVVVATDAKSKQLLVSFDMESNVGKDFALYEEDLERVPYSSADILWVTSLAGMADYVVPTITKRHQVVEDVAAETVYATPTAAAQTVPSGNSSPSNAASSPRKPLFASCVGWMIKVAGEDGVEGSEDLFGVVVDSVDTSKQIMLCFNLQFTTADVVAEEDLECVPFSSSDIVWVEEGHAVPTIRRKGMTKNASKGSKGSKNSSASRLEALPAGTSALSMANALKEKVASIDENLFIQTAQLVEVCQDQIPLQEVGVQHFKKQLVKPAIESCGGCLVRILEDTDHAPPTGGDGTDILTDDTDLFGIVLASMSKKMIQVHFFHETTATSRTGGGIADVTDGEGGLPAAEVGVDLSIAGPGGEDDEENMVEVLPYNSKGVIWYKNVTV